MNLLEPMFSMEFEAIQGQIFVSSPVHFSWDASIFFFYYCHLELTWGLE
jgi:hypothetical protein